MYGATCIPFLFLVPQIKAASGVDLEEIEAIASRTALDPDAEIGPSHSKARRRTPMDDSDLSSIHEQLTASTQRMEVSWQPAADHLPRRTLPTM